MPTTYDNVIAITSQVSTIAGAINRTNIPYSTIALVPNIQHRYQLEVERIFTNDLNGYPAGALVIKQFLEDPLVNIEVKRNLFIIPATYITSYNESTKQLTIVDLAVTTYTYVVTGSGYAYSIPVPPIGSGDKITVRRKTISNTPLVSWTAGTKLTSNQLNLMTTQLLYLQQEVLDRVFYQAILSGDAVTALNSNSVSEEKLTANSVSTIKIQNEAVTNDKIALGEITYDRINTTTSPWAVDLMNTQEITGSKKFSNLAIIGAFSVYPYPVTPAGQQYVLAYDGSNDGATGGVSLTLNNPWNNLPAYILKTDTDQTITGNKTFGSLTTTIIQGNLKITGVSGGTPQINQVLSASDTAGLTKWSPVVTGIYTPDGPDKTLKTGGTVEISPATIGALSLTGGTIVGNTIFSGNVNLGTSITQDIEIQGTFKIRPGGIDPTAGKVLMTSSEGTIALNSLPPNGVMSITMGVGGTVETASNITVTPSKINALSLVDTAVQTVAGPVTFSDTLIIGDNASVDNLTIGATLKYLPTVTSTGQAGKVLTSDAIGKAQWSDVPATGITNITLGSNTANYGPGVSITPASINAPTIDTNENITGIKTFTNGLISSGTFKYTSGSYGNGKVLTSDGDGNASWLTPSATGITTINMGGSSYSASTVSITAALLGAVDTNSTQTIGGDKTFSDNTVLGSTSSKTVHILSPLRYKPAGGTPPVIGMVLTASTTDGDILWQQLDTTGFVTSVNGSTGSVVELTIPTSASIIAEIPTATTGIRGLVRVGGGLKIDGEVLSIDTTGVTLPTATTTTLGAIKIGSGLSINNSGEVSVNGLTQGAVPVTSWKTHGGTARTGDVVAEAHDYTATPNSNTSVTNAVDTITAQNITSTKTFKSNQIITALSDYSVASNGKYGIQLDTTGQINAQRAADVDAIFKGYSAGGATTSYIDGFGNSFFSGTVSSQLGFITTGGVTLGDTVTDSIVLNGTIRIPPGATEDYVLTCTKGVVAGATITGSITGYTLTVTAVTGTIVIGMNLSTTGSSNLVSALTRITAGSGTSWTVNKSQTVTSREIIATSAETGTAAWKTVPNAPVTSVNGQTNIVKIRTNNILAATGENTVEVLTIAGTETMTGEKTFDAATTTFNNNVILGSTSNDVVTINALPKIPLNAAVDKILACSNADGSAGWLSTTIVSSVNNTPPDGNGNVVLSLASISGASTAASNTFSAAQTFSSTVSMNGGLTLLGDSSTDNIVIGGTLRYTASSPAVGKYLTCTVNGTGTEGTVGWSTLPTFIATINQQSPTSGNFNITTGTLGAIDLTTAQNITGTKTFDATTTGLIVTNAAIFNGNVTLGTNQTNTITINSILNAGGGLGQGGPNKVLTSDGAGQIQLQNPLIQSVRGTANPSDWVGRIGNVVLTAADVGAASTQELAATNANVVTAQAKADLAYTTATYAQTTANNKLSEVATMQTDSITMIQGKGTTLDPLQVLRAYPCGSAVGGDLAGTYPSSVTIGANKITYAKMQQLTDAGLLGARAAGNVVQISLGDGLAFETNSNILKCTIASSATLLAAAGTTAIAPQTWGGYNAFTNATAFGSTISAPSGSITGLGISSTAGITAATTLTVGTGLTVTSGGLAVTAGGLAVTAGGLTVTAGNVVVSSATQSTVSTDGALTVAGGVGIAKDTCIAGALHVTGNINGTLATANQSNITGVGTLSSGTVPLSLTSGTLPATKGGTGQSAYAVGDLLYCSAADTLTKLAKPTATSLLQMTSGGAASWVAPPGSTGSVNWNTVVLTTYTTSSTGDMSSNSVANPYSGFTITTSNLGKNTAGVWFTLTPPTGTTWTICAMSDYTTTVLGVSSGTGGGAIMSTGVTPANKFTLAAPTGGSWAGGGRPSSTTVPHTLFCVRTS